MNFEISNLTLVIGQNSKDLLDIIEALSPLIIGVITILFTILFTIIQIKQQHKQWLNDALIKNELNVLIQMKNLISKNNRAIHWYFKYVLSEYIYDDILKPNDFVNQINIYYPQILELYNFYRENYYIFEKYNLLKELKIIHFMVHESKILDEDEFRYVVIEKTKNQDSEYYQYQFTKDVQLLLKEWIKENRPDLLNAKKGCKRKCKDTCSNCSNLNVAIEDMENETYWLIHKFDMATLSGKKKNFDLEKEKDKLWTFEPYTELKTKKISNKIKKTGGSRK